MMWVAKQIVSGDIDLADKGFAIEDNVLLYCNKLRIPVLQQEQIIIRNFAPDRIN